MRYQKSDEQAGGVKAQSGAVGGGHIDDGVDAVNVEEEGEEEQEGLLFFLNIAKRAAQAAETVGDHGNAMLVLGKVPLPVVFQEGQGYQDPPGGGDQEREHHGGGKGKAKGIRTQNQDQTEGEGDAASDISQAIAIGGYLIHAFFAGNVDEHGIIEDQADGIAYFGHDIDHQENHPMADETQKGTTECAQTEGGAKQAFLIIFVVRQRSQNRSGDGNNEGCDGCRVSPAGQIIHGGNACQICQIIKVDGDNGGYHEYKSGIPDIVQDPALFQGGQFEFHKIPPFFATLENGVPCMLRHKRRRPAAGAIGFS